MGHLDDEYMSNADMDDAHDALDRVFRIDSDEDYDFEDIDCEDCGLKFFVRPSLYADGKKPWPRKCPRCVAGLPPKYEY